MRDALDVRNRFTFDCAEWDVSSDELIRTHSNAGDNSGGEQADGFLPGRRVELQPGQPRKCG
jgi:hypothetical protein